MSHPRAGGEGQRPYEEKDPRFEIPSADFDRSSSPEMKDTEAVRSGPHMFSGLVQVHEDEGRSGVINLFHELRSRNYDDRRTEGLTVSTSRSKIMKLAEPQDPRIHGHFEPCGDDRRPLLQLG